MSKSTHLEDLFKGQAVHSKQESNYKGIERNTEYIHNSASVFFWNLLRFNQSKARIKQSNHNFKH